MLNSPYPPKSFLKLIVTATAIFACVGIPADADAPKARAASAKLPAWGARGRWQQFQPYSC